MRRTLAAVLAALAVAASACAKDASPEGAGDGKKDDAGAKPALREGPAAPPKTEEAPTTNVVGDEKWERTPSGLEFQVLQAGGGGKSPRTGDTVKVSYKGWLEGGKVFDASDRHGGPVSFPVGGLIEGWNEALQKMTPGAKWRIRVPSKLGYGAMGQPPEIPPNATLYFELELHAVDAVPMLVKPDPAKAKKTDSGLVYEVVTAGAGDPPADDDAFEIKIAFFNEGGKLLDRRSITVRTADLSVPFLKEAPLLMSPGAVFRFEVPPALCFADEPKGPDLPPNSTTFWEIEMVRVIHPLAVPAFEAPDREKMEHRPSGLLIHLEKEGEGAPPRMGQTVKVHYAGWLEDGTLFDSSYARGEPTEFQVGGVIQGWNEALQTMKPGAVAVLVIPAKLAYGDRQNGDKIKPGSTLIFRVELIGVVR